MHRKSKKEYEIDMVSQKYLDDFFAINFIKKLLVFEDGMLLFLIWG